MDNRNGIIIFLCAASVLLMVSLITKGWYRGKKEHMGMKAKVGVGIWGTVESCVSFGGKSKCMAVSMKMSQAKKGKDKAWLMFGKTGMIVGILSSILLLVVSGLLGSRNPATKKAALATLIGVGITAFCGLMFLVLKPKGLPGIGYSVFLFFPAIGGAIFSSLQAMKALDYLDAQPPAGPPMA